MGSLAFDLLDRHVVAGRADDLAAGSLTFARLLERSAAIAAGLQVLGVAEGDPVGVAVTGVDRVEVVCACIRLGALPAAEGTVRVEDTADGPVVRTVDAEHPLDVVRRAGGADPATAPANDAEGYRERVRELAADVVDPLLAGRAVD